MMTRNHATGMNNMHRGNGNMSKSQIMQVQRKLKGLGYYIHPDGVWGQRTKIDIQNVQYKNGLRVTGRPDADTMRALGLRGNHGLPANQPSGKRNRSASGMNNGMQNGMNHNNNMNNNNMRGGAPSSTTSMGANRGGMNHGTNATMQNGMHSGKNGNMRRLSKQQIMRVQQALNQHGYHVQANGMWNQTSRNALKRYQQKNGLRATGYPNAGTMQSLGLMRNRSMGGANPPSSQTSARVSGATGNVSPMTGGSHGNMNSMNMKGMHSNLSKQQIMHVQMKLNNQGYHVSRNGMWSNKTRSAIIRFQSRNNLRQTGYPDMQTLKALGITRSQWESWSGSNTMAPSARTY
jgi:peptidoglycan hydrolase-like protein with peptidoglycan-binding domain